MAIQSYDKELSNDACGPVQYLEGLTVILFECDQCQTHKQ